MGSVRKAEPPDALAAVDVIRASIVELCIGDHRNDAETLARWLENKTIDHFLAWISSERHYCVVAEDETGICGVGLIENDGELQLCYVRPGMQHRGHGKAILEGLEARAKSWGWPESASRAPASRAPSTSGTAIAARVFPGAGSGSPGHFPMKRTSHVDAPCLVRLLACLVGLNVGAAQGAMEIDRYWEYSDPAGSESRFRAALESARGDERLEILTQIARTHSLRERFDEAHRLLDEVEPQLSRSGSRVTVRYLLERGRTFNSAGEPARAREHFVKAWDVASRAGIEGLAVDAAHMVAITYAGTQDAVPWNERGLALARRSNDPKARALIPAMLNNAAWDLQDRGRYAEALPLFEEALSEWSRRGKPQQIRIAKWSVARCLRSLGRFQEALDAQRALEKEYAAAGEVNRDVLDEIAANQAALRK